MHILITGASGFIGQALTTALLTSLPDLHLTITDIVEPCIPDASSKDSHRITTLKSDLTSPSSVDAVLSKSYDTIYLLHGIMSSGAEANLELGLAVNVDSFRLILDVLRKEHKGTMVIFPSSLAVYGPTSADETVSEKTCPIPQSSYGTQKLIVETLLNDYSRRGLLDARIARLPTVMVRPGTPTAAASSFASGIIRESLKGEKNVLPVDEKLAMWVCSPKIVVENLVKLRSVGKERFGLSRVVCLPGQVVSVGEILDVLEEVGGKEARELVEKKRDETIERIVGRYVYRRMWCSNSNRWTADIMHSWPAQFDTTLAKSLGLSDDITLKEIVETFAMTLQKRS
jgi:nucleoside-diphosphate-sugar epimerase